MGMLWGKIVICIIVGLIITIGVELRPQAQKPLTLLQQSGVFTVGVMVGIVMLTTHSLYITGH